MSARAGKAGINYSQNIPEIIPAPEPPDSLEAIEAAFNRPHAVTRRPYRRWGAERLGQLQRLRDEGLSWREIGTRLRVRHVSNVRTAYNMHVLGRPGPKKLKAAAPSVAASAAHWRWTDVEDRLLLDGARTLSNADLARMLGRSVAAVDRRLYSLRSAETMSYRGPIRLKKILKDHGIACRKAAELYGRKGLSSASVNKLCNHNLWPKVRGLREHIVKVHKEKGLPHDGLFEPLKSGEHAHEEEHEMLTKVYLQPKTLAHYGLARDPFADEPGRRAEVFADKPFEAAVAQIVGAAKEQRMMALCADVGAGKSTLWAFARELLLKDDVVIIESSYFEMGRLHAGGIVEDALRAFGQTPRATLVGRRRQLEEVLRTQAEAGRPVALVFDEAHRMNDRTFSALKLFWEMKEGYSRFLALILIGQRSLEFRLKVNADFREMGERCQIVQLPTLTDQARLADYLKFKLRLAGGQLARLITHHAVEAIAERASTPQMANNLAARVLETAWKLGEKTPIRKEVVERALRGDPPQADPTAPARPHLKTLPGGTE